MNSLEQQHYSRLDVKHEIARFAQKRWIGIHCIKRDAEGNRIMIRYLNGKPITISSPNDIDLLWQNLRDKGVRTIYATAAKYHKLISIEDVKSITNMLLYTPTWDIDNDFNHWKSTIKACLEIIEALKDEGIEKSIYVKWSGDGAHVHLHEKALTNKSLKGRTPIDVAYAIVEYIRLKVEPRIQEIAVRDECNLKVENKIDRQRMFTCPLSLHRDNDRVCICMKPNQLQHFKPSWVNPKTYYHNSEWDYYEEGEADQLAEKAISIIGGLPPRKTRRRKYSKLDEAILRWLRISNDM
ncbi:MAG: hypothetical protein DRJ60_01660 [Thermoprotei archaeon]|nr:MAG: hypothetical protein DRJ60_01660 [Thermoprotei archaeon]